MINFKRTTQVLGLLSFFLLLGIFAIIFFGFVGRESIPVSHVHFSVKEKANSLDIWMFSNGKKYRIKAAHMVKQESGVIFLSNDKLWIYEPQEPVSYISSDKAYVYPNHNIRAFGNVFFERKDLRIYGSVVFWDSMKRVMSSNEPFRGYNSNSKFNGRSFVYYSKTDKLIVNGVNLWLK